MPVVWPDALTRRWRVEVGEGYSTPILVGDRLYVFARREGREEMIALDASSGAELWRSGYSAPYSPSKATMAHGSGPKATPAFAQGRLFTQGVSGIVAAFDASSGKLLWRTLDPPEHPYYSAASSPVVAGGMVVVHPGNYGPLTAFDVDTGDVRWIAGAGGLFASPSLARIDNVDQIVTGTVDGVIGVAPADGSMLWRYPWPDKAGAVSPLLDGNRVFVGGFEMGMAAFTLARRDGRWAADHLWAVNDVSLYLSHPVLIADTVYGFSHRGSGQLFAIDAASGKVLWLGRPREAQNSALATAADFLFLLHDDGELIVAKSSRTGLDALKRYTVADRATWAQPVFSGRRIFVRDVTSVTLWTID